MPTPIAPEAAPTAPQKPNARSLRLMVGLLVVVLIGATIRIYAWSGAPRDKPLVPLVTLAPPPAPPPVPAPAVAPVAEPDRPGPDGPPADLDPPTTAPTRAGRPPYASPPHLRPSAPAGAR